MSEFTTWSDLLFNSLQTFTHKFMGVIPNILGAFIILILGWFFAKIMAKGINRLLELMKFDLIAQKIGTTKLFEKANIEKKPSQLVSTFFYYILLLMVIISASDALGWTAVSREISKLLSYLPNLLIAIVVFIVGVYIATFMRDLIRGATASLGIGIGKIISILVFYLLVIIVSLTSLEQAGVDTSIITSNLLMILGAILIAAAISYGFASKDILSNILAIFFSRRIFIAGQTIEVDGERGRIIAVNNISITIKNMEGEKVVIPANILIKNKVKILD